MRKQACCSVGPVLNQWGTNAWTGEKCEEGSLNHETGMHVQDGILRS